jgi:hypothetical protein
MSMHLDVFLLRIALQSESKNGEIAAFSRSCCIVIVTLNNACHSV